VVHSTWRAIGQAVSIYLAIGSCAVTAQDNRPGRATFAEMIAYARLAVGACERLAPDAETPTGGVNLIPDGHKSNYAKRKPAFASPTHQILPACESLQRRAGVADRDYLY
jgi:hypothetical protein